MGKSFDDLFEEFFEPDNEPAITNLKAIIGSLMNFTELGDLADKTLEEEFGEPDTTEEMIRDGLLCTIMIWNRPEGQYVKQVVTDVLPEPQDTRTLEEKLAEAVKNEDYQTAIKIRDEIKKEKKRK